MQDKNLERNQDITKLIDPPFYIYVNGKHIQAVEGESVLSALLASNIRRLMTNDYGAESGAYCGMGICHCCLVHIDGRNKQKACQTIVQPDMKVETNRNFVLEHRDEL